MLNLEQIEAMLQSLKGTLVSVAWRMSPTRNVFYCISGLLADAGNFDDANVAYFCVTTTSGEEAVRFTSSDIISFSTHEHYGRPVIGITL